MSDYQFYDEEIAKYERRVKKILANPDPTRPKSNFLMYEMERDTRVANIESAAGKGRPLATGLFPGPLFKAMGMDCTDSCGAADRAGGERAKFYLQQVQKLNLPYQTCDRTVVSGAMRMCRHMPAPSFIVQTNWECENMPLSNNFICKSMGIPSYYLDVPYERSEKSLAYVTAQLREIIAMIEGTVPGTKYNEAEHVKYQEQEREWGKAFREIYPLRKQVPCPLAGIEAFREPRWPCMYSNGMQSVNYMNQYRDDLYAMVAKGKLPLKEEKLRFMWAVSGPFHDDVFTYLATKGVSIPWFQIGNSSRTSGVNGYAMYGEEKEYGRKLTPLEEDARMLNRSAWGGLGRRWIEDIKFLVKDLSLDGVVYFRQWGCTTTVGLGRITAEELEKELGVPVLLTEGRMIDTEGYSGEKFRETLDEFIDIALEKKSQRTVANK